MKRNNKRQNKKRKKKTKKKTPSQRSEEEKQTVISRITSWDSFASLITTVMKLI